MFVTPISLRFSAYKFNDPRQTAIRLLTQGVSGTLRLDREQSQLANLQPSFHYQCKVDGKQPVDAALTNNDGVEYWITEQNLKRNPANPNDPEFRALYIKPNADGRVEKIELGTDAPDEWVGVPLAQKGEPDPILVLANAYMQRMRTTVRRTLKKLTGPRPHTAPEQAPKNPRA